MRLAEVGVALSLLAGCAWSLDDDARADAPAADEAPTRPTCGVFGDTLAHGRVQTLPLGDGRVLVSAAELRRGDTVLRNAVAVVPAAQLADGCLGTLTLADATAGLDTAALPGAPPGEVLAMYRHADAAFAFVRTFDGFDALGVALAPFDAEAGRFVAPAEYLFTGDRPSYGEAALVEDGFVHAYGCAERSAFEHACFVARAPVEQAAERGAWRFDRGAGDLTADIDDAWPIFSGGRGLAVRRDGDRVRVYYVPPLGAAVVARDGLGPTGPWSAERPVAACAPAGFFYGAVSVHPGLATADDDLLTYGVFSFDPVAPEQLRARGVSVPRAARPTPE